MRPRSLILLALVVFGLGGFIWFYERELPSTDERREAARKLWRLEPDEIERIDIEAAGSTLVLQRAEDGSSWELVEPLVARADDARVGRLLEALGGLEKERTLEQADPAELGLEPPSAVLRLRAAGGEDRILRLGAEVPASGNVVAAVEGGGPPVVVANSISSELMGEVDDWRSRRAVPFDRADVQGLEIRSAEGALRLEQREGRYHVVAPLEDLADQDRVDDLLTDVTGLTVEEFLDAGGEETDAAPAVEIELALAGRQQPLLLRADAVAAADGRRRFDVEGERFTAAADWIGELEVAASAWRSRRWSELDSWEVDRLELARGGQVQTFERADGEWRRDGEPVEYAAVSDFLAAALGARGALVETGDPAAAEAMLRLTVGGGDGESEILTLSPTGLAMREGRAARLALDQETVAAIEERLAELLAAGPAAS